MTVSAFETCLIRYHMIGQRLIWSNYILDRLAPKLDPANIPTPFTKRNKKTEKQSQDLYEYALSSRICFDFSVVQLFSLLEIHDDVINHLTTKNRKNLENSLSDAWSIVDKQKTRICMWRNNHTAHGKTYAKDGSFVIISDIDSNCSEGQNELFRASKCAVIYISGFLKNIPEYDSAMKTYKSKSENIKTNTSSSYLKINVNDTLNDVKISLKKNGFNSDFPTKLTFQ